MKKNTLICVLSFILFIPVIEMKAENKNIHIVIETNFGDIEVKLYDETPLHRDNFVKLIEEEYYENQIFHRVIKDFMIQGGDPSFKFDDFKNNIDSSSFDYTIPAEIAQPQLFHKKGVIAAARLGDNVNPGKESSSTQFYIVTGTLFSDQELNLMEKHRFERLKQDTFNRLNSENKEKIKELYRNGEKEKLTELRNFLQTEAINIAEQHKEEVLFTPTQREIYKTIGGTPHLDGDYTVFGEVINGMEVVDEIQKVPTGGGDKPIKSVKFRIFFKEKE